METSTKTLRKILTVLMMADEPMLKSEIALNMERRPVHIEGGLIFLQSVGLVQRFKYYDDDQVYYLLTKHAKKTLGGKK